MWKVTCLAAFAVMSALTATALAGGVYDADNATIAIDGNLGDWAGLSSTPVNQQMESNGATNASDPGAPFYVDRQQSTTYAWDAANLYFLIQETAVDNDPYEGADVATWGGGPWFCDSIGFYGNEPTQDGPWTQFWAGLSTNPAEVRLETRTVSEGPFTDISANGASGIVDGKRYIEFFIPWDKMTYTPANAVLGYQFMLNTLMVDGIDGGFHGQSFPGGGLTPGDILPADESYVKLVPEPMTMLLLGLGGIGMLRRRRA